jgi:hypothetical protein
MSATNFNAAQLAAIAQVDSKLVAVGLPTFTRVSIALTEAIEQISSAAPVIAALNRKGEPT